MKMLCSLCRKDNAKWKDKSPLFNFRKVVGYLHYCDGCRHAGLLFGFIESMDLETVLKGQLKIGDFS